MISIQEADFDVGHEYTHLRENMHGDGAIVTFSGLVRDFNKDGSVSSMFLEHYPGMTEKSLNEICSETRKRWSLGEIRIIHRIGKLLACEQIVFVGITSTHRKAAFEAAEFIMDHLKTKAPLWKQEGGDSGMQWVQSKASDGHALSRWQQTKA